MQPIIYFFISLFHDLLNFRTFGNHTLIQVVVILVIVEIIAKGSDFLSNLLRFLIGFFICAYIASYFGFDLVGTVQTIFYQILH